MEYDRQHRRARFGERSGLSLLETTMAMGIFAVTVAVAGQILAGFSGSMHSQEQRHAAIEHCRAVLAQMRLDRDNSVLPFPQQVTALWPDGIQTNDPAFVSLPNETITVNYTNPDADPLRVTITARWTDTSGRQRSVSLSSMLTGTNR